MDELAQRDARLRGLEEVDKNIIQLLTLSGQCLQELAKEKPTSKTTEAHCTSFIKLLGTIDGTLTDQVSHLQQISTGVSHEGTHYDCAKEREVMLRCHGDLEEILSYLVEQKNLYLAEQVTTSPTPVEADASMAAFDEPTHTLQAAAI